MSAWLLEVTLGRDPNFISETTPDMRYIVDPTPSQDYCHPHNLDSYNQCYDYRAEPSGNDLRKAEATNSATIAASASSSHASIVGATGSPRATEDLQAPDGGLL